MRSRRDQLQAYQFLRRRIIAALLSGEPDSPEAPMRRIVRTAFAGIMIAVMIAATFGIVGVIRKGGATSWQKADTIVIDKDSAAVYVWVAPKPGEPRRLHPMVNLTSARLFLGSDEVRSVSAKSLVGIPRAPQKGIREAPQSVPDPKDLVLGPWTVCARTSDGAPQVTLLAGVQQRGSPLGSEAGLLVTGSPGQPKYVVWKGERFFVRDDRVLTSFGFPTATAQVVGDAWVNALPQGRDLAFPDIPDRGQPGPTIGGRPTQVGQVFKLTNLDTYAVTLGTGLAAASGKGLVPISEVVALLLLSDPGAVSKRARELSPAEYSAAVPVDPPANLVGYPERPLQPASGQGREVLCTSVSGSGESATPQAVYAVGELPGGAQVVDLRAQKEGGRALADQAYLRAGSAALVQAHGPNRTRFLVTDFGKKFPIGNREALRALGLESARVAMVPAQFLDLLPDGPPLSREEAAKVAG